MDSSAPLHVPVLRDEVLAALEPRRGQVFVDGTLGAGGHTRAWPSGSEPRGWSWRWIAIRRRSWRPSETWRGGR